LARRQQDGEKVGRLGKKEGEAGTGGPKGGISCGELLGIRMGDLGGTKRRGKALGGRTPG